MMFQKYVLPPDVYLRHLLVARELRCSRTVTVLDVGGSLGELKKFVSGISVTTADVIGGGDVVYDGDRLPFAAASFDAVVSIDTLEHLPGAKRVHFVEELKRVAKQMVILIAPYASPRHSVYEKELIERLKKKKRQIPDYLLEHVKYGLVTDETIADIIGDRHHAKTKLIGSVAVDKVNFSIHSFEVSIGKVNKMIYYLKFLWNVTENILVPVIIRRTTPDSASRVMIVITT